MNKTIAILGSTGSIGRQTLDVVEKLGLKVEALTAHSDVKRMEEQARKFRPRMAVMVNEAAAQDAEAAFAALQDGGLPPEAHTLWIAPLSFKQRVLELLDREIAKGPKGRVAIKVNGMNNIDLMEKLIECSQAGVLVELFIGT